MRQIPRIHRKRGFTIKDVAVALTCVVLAAGMLTSLSGANRGLSQATVCASNQHTLFGGLAAYVNTYNSYPPHNPYPSCVPPGGFPDPYSGDFGFDPNTGWILTYGLSLTSAATYSNGHFKWTGIDDINQLPQEVVCPAANLTNLFTANPEIDTYNIESFFAKYAAFYQTSGTCRAATPLMQAGSGSTHSVGGRNPPIADPTSLFTGRAADNAQGSAPSIWVYRDVHDIIDPGPNGEQNCWVQAVRPAEVQDPARVYYLADSRDWRPIPGSWPSAAINDGWLSGWGNKILLGTRHCGYANVMYLDGRVSRDNQAHIPEWNMNYDSATGQALSDQWRCATFADTISAAGIGTQHHIMPVLMVKGWESVFNADGVMPK